MGAEAAVAQYTPITAASGSLQIGGNPISTGNVIAIAVNSSGQAIPVHAVGGGLNGVAANGNQYTALCAITSGGITGTCRVPDANTANGGVGVRYNLQISDTSTNSPSSGQSFVLTQVQGISGATWALDQYIPSVSTPAAIANTYTIAAGPPTGVAPFAGLYLNSTNNTLYLANNGAWVLITGSGGASITIQTNGTANTLQTTLNIKSGTNVTVTPDGSGGVTFDAPALAATVGNEVSRATTAEGILTTNLANEVTNRTTAVNLATAGAISGILPSAGTVIADYQLKDNAGTAPGDSSGNGNTGAFPGSAANPTWYAGGITLSGGQYFNSAGTTNAKTIMVQYCMNYRTSGPSPIAPQFDTLFGNNSIAGVIFDSQSYQYGYSPALSVNGAPQTTWTGGSLTGCHNLIATLGTASTNVDAIYLDGLLQVTGPATTFGKSNGIYACGGASSTFATYLNGTMQRCTFWSTYLTASQALQAASLARTQAITQGNSFGINAPITTVSQIAATGDSLTNGEGVTPYTASLSTNVTFNISNFGIGNIGTYLIYPMLATREASVYAPQAPWNIDIYWAATNDVSTLGKTPASAVANILASCRQLKSIGFKVIVAGPIDRTGQSTNMETIASLLRAQALTQCDGFVDLTAVPLLGASGANTNTTYFQVDAVHLTAAGQVLVAGYMSNAVNALTGSSPIACDPALVTSATYASTAADGCKVFNAASNAIVDTLPSAVGYTGRVIKRCNNTTSGTNAVTITAPSDYPFNNVTGSTTSVIAAGACQNFKASVVSTTAGGDYWQTF